LENRLVKQKAESVRWCIFGVVYRVASYGTGDTADERLGHPLPGAFSVTHKIGRAPVSLGELVHGI